MKNKYFIWIALLFLPLAASSQEEAAFAIQFDEVLISDALEILETMFDFHIRMLCLLIKRSLSMKNVKP